MSRTVERDERLDALAGHLEVLGFALSGPEAEALRAERDRVVRLLRGVVGRTADPAAPLLVVVAGGSGAGKSTTVNTLAGASVSAGVSAASVVLSSSLPQAATRVAATARAASVRHDRVEGGRCLFTRACLDPSGERDVAYRETPSEVFLNDPARSPAIRARGVPVSGTGRALIGPAATVAGRW